VRRGRHIYVQKGKLKLTVVSDQGQRGVIAILEAGRLLRRGCLAGQIKRMARYGNDRLRAARLRKSEMIQVLQSKSRSFRNCPADSCSPVTFRIEEDLVDQLFNSSESGWRAAAPAGDFGKEGKPER